MDKSHQAWLDNHPGYDYNWLRQAIEAGFDVHHIDSDHDNNDPGNLLLVEKGDHSKIHNLKFGKNNRRNGWFNLEDRVGRGEHAYRDRIDSGDSWGDIGNRLGLSGESRTSPASKAISLAKAYAVYHGKLWPLPHPDKCKCFPCQKKRRELLVEYNRVRP